jgi:hypothetical protein
MSVELSDGMCRGLIKQALQGLDDLEAAAFRDAGFACVGEDHPLRGGLPWLASLHRRRRGLPVYTRNGLAVVAPADNYEVRRQGTGERLAELPADTVLVERFFDALERGPELLQAALLDLEQEVRVQQIARRLVQERLLEVQHHQECLRCWLETGRSGGSA